MPTSKPRVYVTFDETEYEQIQNISHQTGDSMSDIVRSWAVQGLNGELNVKNINMITKIIRAELEGLLNVHTNRLAAISSKTCIQAGTAAYLSAEAILKFVPPAEQMNVEISYEQARKKAVAFLKGSFKED